MSVEELLQRGRAMAETLMVDACTIRRQTGESTGPGGIVTPTWTELYSGKCRWQQHQAQARGDTAGEAYQLMLGVEVQVPIAVTGLQPDDEVICTSSLQDPDLAGRTVRIRDLSHKTHLTMRRIQCQERTS